MKYRPEIDGLRALAVFPVILFHAGFQIFSGGYVGVDIFYVISGYLITSIILEDLKKNQFSLVNFYQRRARRILPALLVVMMACLPFAWVWLTPGDMIKFSKSLIYVSTYISNFFFMKFNNYFDSSSELSPLLHTWSLSVEEQYYLIFPVLMIYLWKNHQNKIRNIYLLLALSSLIAAIVLTHLKPSLSFYMLATRAWEILIGALAAKYQSEASCFRFHKINSLAPYIGLVLILLSIFTFDGDTPTPGYFTLLPVMGAALIITYARDDHFVGYALSRRPMIFFGLISYSMYLWHQPVFAFARIIHITAISAPLMAMLVLATIALAYLTWKYIEMPFRHKNLIGNKLAFSIIAVVTMAMISVGGAGTATEGFAKRFFNLNTITTKNTDHLQRVNTCFLLDKNVQVFDLQNCTANLQKHKKILLIGDSHSASLYPGLRDYLAAKNIETVMMTAAFCLPLVETFPSLHNKAANNRCETINNQVVSAIQSSEYDLIVLSAYMHQWGFTHDWSWSYPRYYNDFLAQIRTLAQKHPFLVVGQFPIWPHGLEQVFYKEAIDFNIKRVEDFQKYSFHGLDRTIFETDKRYGQDIKNLGANYVSVLDKLCNGQGCARYISTDSGIKLITFDYGHLGFEASEFISRTVVGPEIIKLIQ